jgi:phytoene/squalene synthetase
MTVELFNKASSACSKSVTTHYSSSFSSAINLLHAELRAPIYHIYGFVRLADEIVDTFHHQDKTLLLQEFKQHTTDALERRISLNPILNSFQQTVHQYKIDYELIDAFFRSMESDLSKNEYDRQQYEEYIYGSAEVVGLMCLCVFCGTDRNLFENLKTAARALGAAFQKVNFLRDMRSDFKDLSRMYFPGCNFFNFTTSEKQKIEREIENDFEASLKGILQLPVKARFGVYVAYKYYYSLFKRIKSTAPQNILHRRIRVPDYYKAYIILRAGVKNQLRMI